MENSRLKKLYVKSVWIDNIVSYILFVVPTLFVVIKYGIEEIDTYKYFLVLYFFLIVIFHCTSDYVTNSSVGKKLTGLRVEYDKDCKSALQSSILRRIFEMLNPSFLFGRGNETFDRLEKLVKSSIKYNS